MRPAFRKCGEMLFHRPHESNCQEPFTAMSNLNIPSTVLPRTCIPTPKIEEDSYDWYARHDLKRRAAREHSYDLVFIGDSITHFWSDEDACTHGGAVWHKYFDHRKALNLGYGFDRTQNVLWRLEHGELAGQHPRAIVLNIGTNQFSRTTKYSGDSPEEAAAGVLAVIDKLREMCPEARLIVMAILPRGHKDDAYMRPHVDGLNAILARELHDRPNLVFLNLKDKFTGPDGELRAELYRPGDATHLSPAGYEVWYAALKPCLESLGL